MLSIIVPCLNEEENLNNLHLSIKEKVKYQNYELIIVDDGSKDHSWKVISEIVKKNKNVKGIRLTRNFGKDEAILAGLNKVNVQTKKAITIDCDLQYDPSYIDTMLELMDTKDVKIVEGVKDKKDNSLISKFFNSIFSLFTGINFNQNSYLKLIDIEVINYILSFKESNIFYRGLIAWTGFSSTKIKIKINERKRGDSKYNLISLMIIGLNAVTSFSFLPLIIICIIGFGFIFISTIMTIRIIYLRFFYDLSDGYATLFVLISTSTTIIIFLLSIISLYLSKIYLETKARPKYIIDSIVNNE